ncbi:hypothetical protein [Kytococcus sedentarius]|uniref:hypothetical protein n=1 Tax=Kytococcus sedentarius TaxID=1276 RepID=UPI00194DB361|nr:hypothetical protein [Kytococcus sedentarius]QRO87573.1 hypothetical protein I6J30_00890 [Kytococcus sedentarius]
MRWTTRCVVAVAGLGLLAGCGEENSGGEESAPEAPASTSPAADDPASGEATAAPAEPSTVTVTETTDGDAGSPTPPPAEEPAPEEPAPEEPTTKEPAPEEPAPEEPTTKEPTTKEPADEEPADEEPADEQEVDLEAARAELAEIGGPHVEVALLPGNPESGGSGLFGVTADDEENVVFWKRDVSGWMQIDDSKHPGTATGGVTARILPATVGDMPVFLVEGQFRQSSGASTLLYGFADGRGIVPLDLRGDRLEPADGDAVGDPTLFSSATADDGSKTLVTTRLDLEAGVPQVELGKYPPVEETWSDAGDHLRLQERTGGVPEEERRG